MVIQNRPSPNCHGTLKPGYIMMHHTASTDFDNTVAYMCRRTSAVSAHFVVGKNGEVAQLVPLTKRAWAAGIGGPYGLIPKNSGNAYCVAIEMVNKGDNRDEYTTAQLRALDELIAHIDKEIGRKLPIIDHKTYAPRRKIDMRSNFPLDNYQIYRSFKKPVKPKPFIITRVLKLQTPMMKGNDVKKLQRAVKVAADGVFGKDTEKAVKVWQKDHKIRVSGIVDQKTAESLGWVWGA